MDALQIISSTLASEFSDLSNIEMGTRVTLRLLLAALLGGLLGFERESQGQAAGIRTHMLVALGAALFVVVPEQSGAMEDAMSRVIQGVVAGVGFLCAGTILKSDNASLKSDNAGQIRGLTTAAGLWLTAAMGVAIGMGYEATAVLSTFLALAVLHLLPYLIGRK